MSSFSDLPTEVTMDILAAAISQHPNPSCILAVNRRFNDIGQFIIYTSLRFKSESQLARFALKRRFYPHHHRGQHAHHSHHHHDHHHHRREHQEANGTPAIIANVILSRVDDTIPGTVVLQNLLPHSPRSISVRIPGGQGGGIVFEGIKHVFEFCAEAAGTGVLSLDSLEFCLHSHTNDPTPWKVGEALSLVNPRKFVWTGPDPPHHFSTAIVPYATYYLLQSIATWSNLQSLSLTNISFPSHGTFVPVRSSGPHLVLISVNVDEGTFLPLDTLTNLRSVYIGQATLVPMRSIVRLVLARPQTESSTSSGEGKDVRYYEREAEGRNSGLREMRLVDAYKESIWQKRIRRKDLEAVALELASSDTPIDSSYHAPTGEVDSRAVVERIREIVSCEALTERIMGGDRAEGMTTLD